MMLRRVKLPWSRAVSVFIALAMSVTLVACERPTSSVNLHGVNYTIDTFSYAISNIATPEEESGGELIDPYGAGGISCCVELPRRWQAGLKLHVRTSHWVEDPLTKALEEFKQTHLVDVPPYADKRPGDLWVLRKPDGKVEVVVSDYQPDHPKWPGDIKGWPVPSLEYRRQRWDLMRKHEDDGVTLYIEFLSSLERDPKKETEEAWQHAREHQPDSLNGYSGPEDPQYRRALKARYSAGLADSKARLQRLMEMRP